MVLEPIQTKQPLLVPGIVTLRMYRLLKTDSVSFSHIDFHVFFKGYYKRHPDLQKERHLGALRQVKPPLTASLKTHFNGQILQ